MSACLEGNDINALGRRNPLNAFVVAVLLRMYLYLGDSAGLLILRNAVSVSETESALAVRLAYRVILIGKDTMGADRIIAGEIQIPGILGSIGTKIRPGSIETEIRLGSIGTGSLGTLQQGLGPALSPGSLLWSAHGDLPRHRDHRRSSVRAALTHRMLREMRRSNVSV